MIIIKYRLLNPLCSLERYGVMIDLKSSETVSFTKGELKIIPLGICMELPKYFEAIIVSRSGLPIKKGLILSNSIGIIDGPMNNNNTNIPIAKNSKQGFKKGYSGNSDVWKACLYALKSTIINEGDRLVQFKIQPVFDAPWWVWLKYFTNKFQFIKVDTLTSSNRGGHGSTGI